MPNVTITGTIVKFDPVKGFGAISAADGRELAFDVGVCRFGDPRVGEPVSFQLGPSRLGGERVAWVERKESRRLARASAAPPMSAVSSDTLVAAIADSEGDLRLLLEELMRRRAGQIRVHQALRRAVERFEACKTVADYTEVVADLQTLYGAVRPE